MAENTDLLPWVLCGMFALGAGAVTADPSPAVVSPNARSQLPPGQVWECMIDGQRVFSDAQCGAHASIRRLSELNVMDSTAVPPRGAPRPYGRDPDPAPSYDAPPLAPSDAGVDEANGSEPIYTSSQVVVVRERGRRDHVPHRPNHHHPRATRP